MHENRHLFGSGSNCKVLCVRVLAQNAVILEEMEKKLMQEYLFPGDIFRCIMYCCCRNGVLMVLNIVFSLPITSALHNVAYSRPK